MARRPIAYALLLWYLPACITWHVEPGVSPEQLIATQHPDFIRVTRTDSSRLVLRQPRIAAGDSVSGVHNGAPSSVAISDITQVGIRKFNAGRTIGLLLGMSAIIAGVVVVSVAGSIEN